MSQENVKTVLDATAAFNRGDLDTWSEYRTDDIDHRPVLPLEDVVLEDGSAGRQLAPGGSHRLRGAAQLDLLLE
jgi:hypothetical protein